MKNEKGVSTRLWIEQRINQADHDQSGAVSYAEKKIQLTKDTIKLINQYVKAKDVSWHTLISAATGLLLSRLSSVNDVYLGIGDTKEFKLITLLADIKEQTTVGKYLKTVAQQMGKKRPRSVNTSLPRYVLLFRGKGKIKMKEANKLAVQHPLAFVVDAVKPEHMCILYSRMVFTSRSINYLAAHLNAIIKSLCLATHNDKVFLLNLLTDIEKKKIFSEWNTTKSRYHIRKTDKCIHDLFLDRASETPKHIAIYHQDKLVNYSQLASLTTAITGKLLECGVHAGDNVCVLMDRSPTLIATMLAIFRCGAVFIPINPKYPEERISYVISDSKPATIVAHEKSRLPKIFHDKTIELSEKITMQNSEKLIQLPKVSPEDLAYVVYTSGTTGSPKGVMIKHKSLLNFIEWYKVCFNLTANDRASQFASQGFDSFFCETVPFLAIGASICIVDDNIKLTPPLFFEWLKEYKVTVCDMTTAYAQILFCLPWPTGLSLRLIKVGGEALTHYPEQEFSFDIWNTYGPTEATIEATFKKIYEANHQSLFKTHKEAPSIGKPIINSEVYIVDNFMQPVPPGVVGELLIGGDNVSSGYLNRHELTNERFVSIHVNGVEKKNLYRTGDLVKWLDSGEIDYVGRLDHQIKIRGYRIEPGEIEHVISLFSDVKETVVIAQDTMTKEKILIAYVVPNLDKERYLYQQRCLIAVSKDNFFEAITDDISKEGLSVSGISEGLLPGKKVMIHVRLPGMSESRIFKATVVWVFNGRCGMRYELNEQEKSIVSKSIDHYLQTHNVMDMILSNASKRSLKKALNKKMPEYMIPSSFVKLLELPLNYNGKVDISALPTPQSANELFKASYVPPSSDIEKRMTAVWSDILKRKDISMSDNFFDIGGNSIAAAELSVKILKEFKIIIPVKLLFDLSYIPILSQYIETKGLKYNDTSSIQDDVRRDGRLDDQIQPTFKITANLSEPKHVLLTGAGGFLGIYLLRELLKRTNAKIYCLIRQGDHESVAKRLEATIRNFDLQNDISLSDKRIVVIASDLSHDRFGLTKNHYESLQNKIDLIYHCGAQVNIMASYGKLRGSNVQGTNEIIKFATKGQDKPIHYVSTLSSAYCRDENGLLIEAFPTTTYDHIFGGYAISKWVSERLLTQIKDRGLPVTIYRSGYIFGQSDTGITSLNDALLMLIKGCIQLGYAPIMHEKITLLPVDYVSKSIVDVSIAQGTRSDVYHIDHPTGIMLSDLISWLNNYGYKIKMIPMPEWRHMLEKIEPDNALFPFLPYYLSLKDDYACDEVDVTKAAKILNQLSLPYPPIDDRLLRTYVDYLLKIGFLPDPAQEKSHTEA